MAVTENEAAQIKGPVAIDAIGPADDWESCWKERDLGRRQKSPWAGNHIKKEI